MATNINGRRKVKQRRAAITVTLGVDVITGLNLLAEKTKIPFSELVDNILRQYLAQTKKEETHDDEA